MAVNEGVTLNGLALNSGPEPAGPYTLEKLDLTPPKKLVEMVEAADADGGWLIRSPRFPMRPITARVRIEPQTTMNVALEKIAAIADQLAEADKTPGGIPLVWTPSNSTKSVTFYVVTGEITGIPITVEGEDAGWFVKAPVITLALTARPFGYGPEEEVLVATNNETGLSIAIATIAGMKGEVPAEARLIVKDTAGTPVGRRSVEWGLESRYLNAATKLVIDSEDLVPVGGTQNVTLAGAYKRVGATNSSIATTLVPEPTVCCETGNLSHVGTFRVKARCYAKLGAGSASANIHARLSWQDGEGPFRGNDWQTPVLGNNFIEFDFGIVTITPAVAGTQKWSGKIEGYSTNEATKDIFHVDYLELIPVLEGYGRARGIQSTTPGTITAFDNFTTGTLSGALNARVPAAGAAWATSGAATDWTVEAAQAKRASKSDTEPRLAVLGAALGNSKITMTGTMGADTTQFGVILRWVDANNYVAMYLRRTNAVSGRAFLVTKVAGVVTVLQEVVKGGAWGGFGGKPLTVTFALAATVDGTLTASLSAEGTTIEMSASSAAVATGGALASGKPGVTDEHSGAGTSERLLRSVNAASLPATPYAIQPGKTLEVRADRTLTTDPTGVYTGPVSEYRGSRFLIPAAGSANRSSRLIVKADRNDLKTADQGVIGDPLSVQVMAVPRYVTVPR